MMTITSKEKKRHIEEEEEGQWKNLPNDILALILRRFHTKPDLCRFRSICKSWRSFATPIQLHLLFPLILPPLHPNSRRPFSLSPIFLYIFSPNFTPHHHHHYYNINTNVINNNNCWLTKVEETGDNNNNNKNKWLLLNPLTNEKLYSFFPRVFENVINLLGFRNLEVGRSYRVQFVCDCEEKDDDDDDDIWCKAVVLIEEKISVVALNEEGEIALWDYGDGKWEIIEFDKEENKDVFDDVICYDGKFYAVERAGRLVMINPNTELVEVISSTKECNDSRFTYLLESDFRLYMVTKVVNPRVTNYFDDHDDDNNNDNDNDDDKSSVGKLLGFRVYVLNEREKRWEKVNSLGNKVFLVSGDTVFSASAEDLGWSKGNCIFFEGLTWHEANLSIRNAGVYTLEDEAIVTCDSPVDHRTRILWPPLSWIAKY